MMNKSEIKRAHFTLHKVSFIRKLLTGNDRYYFCTIKQPDGCSTVQWGYCKKKDIEKHGYEITDYG